MHRRFSDALAFVMKNSESNNCNLRTNPYYNNKKRRSLIIAVNSEHLLAEDLLDITRENEMEIAASQSQHLLYSNGYSKNASYNSSDSISNNGRAKSYTTSLFPKVTQV